MSRNNQDRLGGAAFPDSAAAPPQNVKPTLDFITPTELVDLPSEGKFYPQGHPLHGKSTIEIRYMTAKDEDILTSESLLRKGVAIDRFVDNIIVDKQINSSNLLIGDKNAIIIAARISGYGADYETKITCPSCGTKTDSVFDLNEKKVKLASVSIGGVENSERGTFVTELPLSKLKAEIKVLYGVDEKRFTEKLLAKNRNKSKSPKQDTLMTDQIKNFLVSLNGLEDRALIEQFVDGMPAMDARHLRKMYREITPDIKIVNDFSCSHCGHEQELEVPFGADFFWPDSNIHAKGL